ncbi:MAG: hypothetical protein IKZ21_06610 [Clostridia bacterium]|nr:hypothetical protein [Clostridia bacterium]
MPLSCAIVGNTSLLPHPNIAIRAVCDPSEEDGKALAAMLECPWYACPEEMLAAQPGLEALWLCPDGAGRLFYDPVKLAAFGRHLVLDLSLPITTESYNQVLSVATRKGARVHTILPPIPDLPDLGELYALEVRGYTEFAVSSPLDHLPLCLNQGLAILLSLGGPPSGLQGCFDRSAAARLSGFGGPDKIGLQVTCPTGAIGQLLLLPATESSRPGWTVTVTGSEDTFSFHLPTDAGPDWRKVFTSQYDPTLYPALISLRRAVSALLHPYH